jgi:glycosyltransferase involved in cell wall biosynthesis
VGLPIVGLATTEMATAIENGVSGYVDTRLDVLEAHMRELLENPAEARRLGEGARRQALTRFSIDRFVRDWNAVFAEATAGRSVESAARRPVAVALQD